MDKTEYLLSIDKEEVYKTWKALGSLTVDSNVSYYQKDTLFKVNIDGNLKDALVWCKYSYIVDREINISYIIRKPISCYKLIRKELTIFCICNNGLWYRY